MHILLFFHVASYSTLIVQTVVKMARFSKKMSVLLLVALVFCLILAPMHFTYGTSKLDNHNLIVKHGRKISTVLDVESHYENSPEVLQLKTKDHKNELPGIKPISTTQTVSIPPSLPSDEKLSPTQVEHKEILTPPKTQAPPNDQQVIVKHQTNEHLRPALNLSSITSVKNGVVLAVNFYEQQTMASRNMFQLQCWAKTLNLDVVQPATKDSFLLTPLDEQVWSHQLRFQDLYDIAEWDKFSKQHHHSSLINWETFLNDGPRKVIIASFNYPSVSVLKARQRARQPILHPPVGDRYKNGCDRHFPTSAEIKFLNANSFVIVRRVCFNFYYGDELSLSEFNSHLLGEYSNNEVTIVMEMWRGMSSGQRVLIKNFPCSETYPIQEIISPSPRLLRDAESYVNAHFPGGHFLAVMGRYEMSLLTSHKSVPYCLKDTLYTFQKFKKDTHMDHGFLAIDVGKYGSKKWRKGADSDIMSEVDHLFHGVYGDNASISEWEKGFESVSGTIDAGYIGLLQKVIVTRAQCVLFVGGGAFQRHALYLYKSLHRNSVCARVVDQCTSKNKFRL